MADEPHEGHEGQPISLSDLIRLKHQLGKSITWGKSDLNALEIEKLTELTREDYARIRKEYREWRKHLNVINMYVLAVIVLACVGVFFLSYGWLKIAAIGVGITCFAAISRREGPRLAARSLGGKLLFGVQEGRITQPACPAGRLGRRHNWSVPGRNKER